MDPLTIILAISLAIAVFLLVRKPDAVGSLEAAVKLLENAEPKVGAMGGNTRRVTKTIKDIDCLIEELNEHSLS